MRRAERTIRKLSSWIRLVVSESVHCPQTRDDLFQDSAVLIIKMTPKYRDLTFPSYVRLVKRSVRNLLIDKTRRDIRIDRRHKLAAKKEMVEPEFVKRIEREDMYDRVNGKLSGTSQAVFGLMRIGSIETNEIGKSLGVSRVTVWRAVKQIQEVGGCLT